MSELENLRSQLSALDVEILQLVARRQELVTEITQLKTSTGKSTRDYVREKQVIQIARDTCKDLGLDEHIGEAIFRLLIRASLAKQEQHKILNQSSGDGKRALVIGGSGLLGSWFVQFLDNQGYRVEICDPVKQEGDFRHFLSLADTDLSQQLIVVAAPINQSCELLIEMAGRKPAALVFDVASVKNPLRAGLKAMQSAGCKITSVHPMFGSDTRLLSGKHVIFIDLGVPQATAEAKALFDSTMVEQVDMDLDAHDKAIAYVLGLSHALNIAFFTALAESGERIPNLAKLSSSTFDAQLEVSSRVALDNPSMYFEIQSLNNHSPRALVALLNAVSQVTARVLDGDLDGFTDLMLQGRDFLADRPQDKP
jgi:chorismate mutase/prephenate dehydrogenase